MSSLTVLVCLVIVGILLWYIKESKNLSKYFKDLKEDVVSNNKSKNPDFKNENVKNMYEEFESSLIQTENVNTQVIIEKYMYINNKLARKENILEYLVSFATVLGLLGTFIGLTGAITQTALVLQDVSNMDQFIKELRPAIDSMGGAFITSIFGIVASAIMNFISFGNKHAYKSHKQQFIDEIESYLDNVVAGNRADAHVDKLLVSMTDAVNKMADRVTTSIENSMGQLVNEIQGLNNKITVVSADMTTSAQTLEVTIDKFAKPVNSFKMAMENFTNTYEGMDRKTEEIDKIVNKFIRYFEENMDSQKQGQKIIEESSQNLSENINSLKETYESLINIMNDTDETLRISTKNSNESQKEIKEVISNLNGCMKEFKTSIQEMSSNIVNSTEKGIYESIKQSIEELSKNVAEELNNTTKELNTNVTNTREVLDIMKETIQVIHNQVIDFQEVALDK